LKSLCGIGFRQAFVAVEQCSGCAAYVLSQKSLFATVFLYPHYHILICPHFGRIPPAIVYQAQGLVILDVLIFQHYGMPL